MSHSSIHTSTQRGGTATLPLVQVSLWMRLLWTLQDRLLSVCLLTGSYVEYSGTSMSTRSDANMEHSDSLRSNDTIKITPQLSSHGKTKVLDTCTSSLCLDVMLNHRSQQPRLDPDQKPVSLSPCLPVSLSRSGGATQHSSSVQEGQY